MDAPEGDRGGGFPGAFDRYAPAILGYARRRLDSQEAAWDVVSDTFTSAWRHWDRRPGPDELLPWLYAIAGNSVRDHRRSAERRRRLLARLATVRRDSHAADPAEGVVLGGSIGDALSKLPEADREVLRLVAWEGQTDARALGLVLGVSPAAARSRVHRARRRLRALLADPGLDDPGLADPGLDDPGLADPGLDDPGLADPGGPPPGAAGKLAGSPIRQHAKEV